MHKLKELKEMLCRELETYGNKNELTAGSLEVVDKLAHAIKNIDKILEAYEEEGGQSYEGGRSYRNEGDRSMARGRGANAQRDARGRYSSRMYSRNQYGPGIYGGGSYADGMEEMAESIKAMMSDLPENLQREAQKFVQKLEQEIM